jgi:hypothetical protein
MWIFLLILLMFLGALGIIVRAHKEKTKTRNQADEYEIIEEKSSKV